jgi:hypothetical protein
MITLIHHPQPPALRRRSITGLAAGTAAVATPWRWIRNSGNHPSSPSGDRVVINMTRRDILPYPIMIRSCPHHHTIRNDRPFAAIAVYKMPPAPPILHHLYPV